MSQAINTLNFGIPPQEAIYNWKTKYKNLPIEAIESPFGEIVCRALSTTEIDQLIEESTKNGETNEKLLQINQIKKCVLWPQNINNIIEYNTDNLPGGLIPSIIDTVDHLSCVTTTQTIPIKNYIESLSENNITNTIHPTLEQAQSYLSWEHEKNLSVYAVYIEVINTYIVYRAFSLDEMYKFDKDLESKGGMSIQTSKHLHTSQYICKKLILFPETLPALIDVEYGCPAWLPLIIAEGIYKASGMMETTRKKYN